MSRVEGGKDSYDIVQHISSGTYGRVYQVRRLRDGELLVLKQIPFSCMQEWQKAEAHNEIDIMRVIDHPHIIKYRESFISNGMMNIVMDYARGGDLAQVVETRKQTNHPFDEADLWKYLAQICAGLQYLHEHRILHRDIKTGNVFLSERDEILIGDLGLGRMLGSLSTFAKSVVGTPLYMSPESIRDEPYDAKTDVWALGCLMYELATFSPPFVASNQLALASKIVHDTPAPLPNRYSSQFVYIVNQMLDKCPTTRPTISKILEFSPVKLHLEKQRYLQRENDLCDQLEDLKEENEELRAFYDQHVKELNDQVSRLRDQVQDLTIHCQRKDKQMYLMSRELSETSKSHREAIATLRNLQVILQEKEIDQSISRRRDTPSLLIEDITEASTDEISTSARSESIPSVARSAPSPSDCPSCASLTSSSSSPFLKRVPTRVLGRLLYAREFQEEESISKDTSSCIVFAWCRCDQERANRRSSLSSQRSDEREIEGEENHLSSYTTVVESEKWTQSHFHWLRSPCKSLLVFLQFDQMLSFKSRALQFMVKYDQTELHHILPIASVIEIRKTNHYVIDFSTTSHRSRRAITQISLQMAPTLQKHLCRVTMVPFNRALLAMIALGSDTKRHRRMGAKQPSMPLRSRSVSLPSTPVVRSALPARSRPSMYFT